MKKLDTNIGFEAIDKISYEYNIPMKREKIYGVFGGRTYQMKSNALKPTTLYEP